jgi:hypothetical protein
VVLVDRSLDSTAEVRLNGVKAIRLAATAAIGPKGKVYADGFTANALASLTFPIFADFSQPPPGFVGDNPRLIKLARDAQVAALVAKASRLILPQLRVRGSDMFGALLAAAQGPLSAGGRALIVLESNMLVWSPEDGIFFTDSAPRRSQLPGLLDRLAARGRIPRLRGACVLVVGAGRLDDRAIGTTRYLAVKRFWQAYFARAGANLAGWRSRVFESLPAPCARS